MAAELFRAGAGAKAYAKILADMRVARLDDSAATQVAGKFPFEERVPDRLLDPEGAPVASLQAQVIFHPLQRIAECFASARDDASSVNVAGEVESGGSEARGLSPRLEMVLDIMKPLHGVIYDCLHAINSKTAAGLSGLHVAWLHRLIPKWTRTKDGVTPELRDNGAFQSIVVQLARLYAGALCANGVLYFSSSKLIPLVKKSVDEGGAPSQVPAEVKHFQGSYVSDDIETGEGGGTSSSDGLSSTSQVKIRPICCLEILRRLGDAVLAKLLRIVVERELAVVQMGVAPGGIENVVHAVQHFLFSEVRGSTPSAKFVIALDLKNAFNALSRADLVQLIRRISPQLLPYFRTSLGVPGPVRMQRSRDLVQTVMARSGVPQGSPLSSLLFAMMTMGPLLRAQHEHPGVRIMAAHDDAYILAADAQEGYSYALVALFKYFRMLSLELCVEKTVIYSPTEDVTSDAFAPTWGRFRRSS